MKIRSVTVKTGRTMPNPYHSYANLRTDIILNADLEDEDDPEGCIRELQIKANAAVDTDMQRMLEAMEAKVKAVGTTRDRYRSAEDDDEPY